MFHDEIVARPADVVHHLFAAALQDGLPDSCPERLEDFIPGSACPLAAPPWPDSLHWIEQPVGIMNLIDDGPTLGAQPAMAGWVHGVAFESVDLSRLLVDVGQKAAGRLAVEADGWNRLVAPGHVARPGGRIIVDPVIPLLNRGRGAKIASRALEIGQA